MADKRFHLDRLTANAIIVALIVVTIVLSFERWHALETSYVHTMEVMADTLAVNGSAVMLYGDRDDASMLLNSLAQFPDVVQAALFDRAGKQLGNFKRDTPQIEPIPSLWEQPSVTDIRFGYIRVARPVMASGRLVGTIVLWGHKAYLYREMARFIFSLLFASLFAGGLAYLGSFRLRRLLKTKQAEVERSQDLIRRLSAYREKIISDEQRKIAQELHDGLGQLLSTAILELGRLARTPLMRSEKEREQISRVHNVIEDAIDETRSLAVALRPPVLDVGLPTAIEWLIERGFRSADIQFDLDLPVQFPALDESVSLTIFRIIQEALTNVLRHAKARHVRISMQHSEGKLMLSITDDGVGFTPADYYSDSFGLVGMKERALAIGGELRVDSAPRQGTCISLQVPVVSPS